MTIDNLEVRLNSTTIEIILGLNDVLEQPTAGGIYQWLRTRNIKLQGNSPLMLINRGRGQQVLDFVREWQANKAG